MNKDKDYLIQEIDENDYIYSSYIYSGGGVTAAKKQATRNREYQNTAITLRLAGGGHIAVNKNGKWKK